MEVNSFLQNIPLNWYIILSTTLFCLGVLGVLVRKNAIMAGFATQMTKQDIANVSAWLAAQPGPLVVRK